MVLTSGDRQIRRLYKRGFNPTQIARLVGSRLWYVRQSLGVSKQPRSRKRTKRPSIPACWMRAIEAKCEERCVFCGNDNRQEFTYDHIVPLSKGGLHEVTNLQLACSLCNGSKGDRGYPVWMFALNITHDEKWADRDAVIDQWKSQGLIYATDAAGN